MTEPTSPTPPRIVTPEAPTPTGPPVPLTRTGAAWVAVCAATLIAIALIVFLAQNTRTVEISFLGMTTSTSLALALLIAAVGGILLTVILGTARITQLRRQVRRHPR
jgi:putative membrane protein